MVTREERKAQLYNVFYEEECSFLSKKLKEFNKEPCIRDTRHYAKESKTVISFLIISKLFPESVRHRRGKAILGIIIGTIAVSVILLDARESLLLHIILSTIFVVMITGITAEQLVKIVPGKHMEISSAGIELNDRSFTWNQVMGTYILRRRCKMQLVLLLDNGEIFRQELENYGKFSFRRGKQIAEICQYIEHFKSKVSGW